MITERQFASGYSSFWRELLPGADRFVRRVNLSSRRFADPIRNYKSTARGLVNETGFKLFCSFPHQNTYQERDIEDAVSEASKFISRFRSPSSNANNKLSDVEVEEAKHLANRLRACVEKFYPDQPITTFPSFEGCGVVSHCQGDLLVGHTLLEVKAGFRGFRSSDFKQVLVYLTLNHAAGSPLKITSLGLVNPRLGSIYFTTVDEVLKQVAGLSAVETFEEIADFLCEDSRVGALQHSFPG